MIRIRFLVLAFAFLAGCQSSDRDILDKADQAALDQKSQLAKYLYIQIIHNHPDRDDIRYRAFAGLTELSLTQLFEYSEATHAMDKIISEFESEPFHKDKILDWRLRESRVYREDLHEPDNALDVLRPLLDRPDLNLAANIELGKVFLAERDFKEAEKYFKRAWPTAFEKKDCELVRNLQLDIVQTYWLSNQCDQTIAWTKEALPRGCEPDRFSLDIERANCFEFMGDVTSAMKIYEDMLKKDPNNARAQMMLDGIKKRQKEKQLH